MGGGDADSGGRSYARYSDIILRIDTIEIVRLIIGKELVKRATKLIKIPNETWISLIIMNDRIIAKGSKQCNK